MLAEGLWAYRLGQASAALIFPIAGALLLAVGLYRRRAYNRWNSRDDDRLLRPEPTRDDEPDPDFDPDDEDLVPRPSQPPSRGTVFIVVGAVVLVLGAGHVLSYLAVSHTSTAAGNVDVGQCITAEAFEQRRLNAEAVDCRRSDATLQLVSKGDAAATCPDGLRESTKYPALTNDVRTQCFALNLREGYCYVVAHTVAPVNCTDPSANAKVARRVDGTTEAVGCAVEARAVAYREPPRAYCLVAP